MISAWNIFLSLITSKLAGPIGAVLVIILLGMNVKSCAAVAGRDHTISGLNMSLSVAHARAAADEADLTRCNANGQALETSLNTQKNAVAALQAEGARTTANANRQIQAARSQADSAASIASRILAAPPGADVCKSALDLIRGG